jgi:isoleucyl-tRNA synthetase
VVRNPKEGMAVSAEGSLVVGLDTQLDDDLLAEGLAREFVNKIQSMRKEMDLEVTQRIRIGFGGDAEVGTAVARFRDYIETETLAIACVAEPGGVGKETEWDLNGHPCLLSIIPASE